MRLRHRLVNDFNTLAFSQELCGDMMAGNTLEPIEGGVEFGEIHIPIHHCSADLGRTEPNGIDLESVN